MTILRELTELDRAITDRAPGTHRSAWPVLRALLATTLEIERPESAAEWTALSRILLASATYAAGEASAATQTPASSGLGTREGPPHYSPTEGGGHETVS